MQRAADDGGFDAEFMRTDAAAALTIARTRFGLVVDRADRLDTERDDTFRLRGEGADAVLKIAHPAERERDLAPLVELLLWLESEHSQLPIQNLLRAPDGRVLVSVPSADGDRIARLHRFLSGDLLRTATLQQLAQVGATVADLSLALQEAPASAAPAAEHPWNLLTAERLPALLPTVAVSEWRDALARFLDEALATTLPSLRELPTQLAHNDANPGNLVVDPTSERFVTGILDFGDATMTPAVADLAVAASYAALVAPASADPWAPAGAIVNGYRQRRPVQGEALLPHLIRLRLAQRLILNSRIAAARPDNADYALRYLQPTWQHFRDLTDAPSSLLERPA